MACGFYLNELLLRALPKSQEFPIVFNAYIEALFEVIGGDALAAALRKFEIQLITELGIAPDWEFDTDSQPIQPLKNYRFVAEEGFQVAENESVYIKSQNLTDYSMFSGKYIRALAEGHFTEDNLRACRGLMRELLRQVIGNKPLQSRKLWQHSQK
nr:DNA repair protein RecO C-terminal domain-containing protein [Aliikangiella sp. G2MR2-5]